MTSAFLRLITVSFHVVQNICGRHIGASKSHFKPEFAGEAGQMYIKSRSLSYHLGGGSSVVVGEVNVMIANFDVSPEEDACSV